MDLAVAGTIVRGTHDQADRDAQSDLGQLRAKAVEAARERSRKLIKVTVINEATRIARYNPAGRLLRDWYMHVYVNTLRANLGQPAVVIDAQQVEDLAKLLRVAKPLAQPIRSLQAAGLVRLLAVDDANHAAVAIVERLQAVGAERAVRHAPDERFDGDVLRVHISRHWYLRCYSAQVEVATRSQQPLAGITSVEEKLVAETFATGKPRRVIGRDGLPVATVHETRLNAIDRALASGQTGVVPAMIETQVEHDPLRNLRTQLRAVWSDLTPGERNHWLQLAKAEPMGPSIRWTALSGEQQSLLARHYLHAHQKDLLDINVGSTVVRAEPHVAARRMFNHSATLAGTRSVAYLGQQGLTVAPAEESTPAMQRSLGLEGKHL